jgi:hypothetical protein
MPPLDGDGDGQSHDSGTLLRAQLGPLLAQADEDGADAETLIQLFAVIDEDGRHCYDLHLFCGEDGQLLNAGTTEPVASFSQGFASGSTDRELLDALQAAHTEWLKG